MKKTIVLLAIASFLILSCKQSRNTQCNLCVTTSDTMGIKYMQNRDTIFCGYTAQQLRDYEFYFTFKNVLVNGYSPRDTIYTKKIWESIPDFLIYSKYFFILLLNLSKDILGINE